jgi:predicted amidohydrolase YtcJ
MDDKVGAIEPGRLADLVVLNKDYFAVTDEDIKQIRSVLTVVGGKIVHNDGIA